MLVKKHETADQLLKVRDLEPREVQEASHVNHVGEGADVSGEHIVLHFLAASQPMPMMLTKKCMEALARRRRARAEKFVGTDL